MEGDCLPWTWKGDQRNQTDFGIKVTAEWALSASKLFLRTATSPKTVQPFGGRLS
jgi:hypothetical protein